MEAIRSLCISRVINECLNSGRTSPRWSPPSRHPRERFATHTRACGGMPRPSPFWAGQPQRNASKRVILRLCSLRTWHALRKLGKDMADQFFVPSAAHRRGFRPRALFEPAGNATRRTYRGVPRDGSAHARAEARSERCPSRKSLDTIGGFTRRIAELLEALPRSADKGARALGVGVERIARARTKQAPDDMDNDDEAQTDAIVFQGVTVAAPEPGVEPALSSETSPCASTRASMCS